MNARLGPLLQFWITGQEMQRSGLTWSNVGYRTLPDKSLSRRLVLGKPIVGLFLIYRKLKSLIIHISRVEIINHSYWIEIFL